MTFRDDASAARARAEALEQRLAEQERELEAMAAKLASRDEELRGVAERAGLLLEATRELQALERRGASSEPERDTRSTDPPAPAREGTRSFLEERARQRRRFASVSKRRGAIVSSTGFVIGTLPVSFWFLLWGYPIALAVPPVGVLALLALAELIGRRAWTREVAWATALPYPLVGYPELLEKRRASDGARACSVPDPERHKVLALEIELRDPQGAEDLERILRGFDSALERTNPLGDRRDAGGPRSVEEETHASTSTFYRPSPQRREYELQDHNREVRSWVRRLHAEVLAPLHVRSGVRRVTLRLE